MSKVCEGCTNADLRDDACCRICGKYKAKIREEAVDELTDLIDRLLWNYDETAYGDLAEAFKAVARSVKGQGNER